MKYLNILRLLGGVAGRIDVWCGSGRIPDS
jgi:hypothetical protein